MKHHHMVKSKKILNHSALIWIRNTVHIITLGTVTSYEEMAVLTYKYNPLLHRVSTGVYEYTSTLLYFTTKKDKGPTTPFNPPKKNINLKMFQRFFSINSINCPNFHKTCCKKGVKISYFWFRTNIIVTIEDIIFHAEIIFFSSFLIAKWSVESSIVCCILTATVWQILHGGLQILNDELKILHDGLKILHDGLKIITYSSMTSQDPNWWPKDHHWRP